MYNKKGFTLVELLAVVAVLAIVITIATSSTMNALGKAKKKACEEARGNLQEAAITYVLDKYKLTKCSVSLSEEISRGILSNATDSNTCLKKVTAKTLKDSGELEDKTDFFYDSDYVIVYHYNNGSKSEYKAHVGSSMC